MTSKSLGKIRAGRTSCTNRKLETQTLAKSHEKQSVFKDEGKYAELYIYSAIQILIRAHACMWVDVRKKTKEKWARMCWFLYEHMLLSY